MSAALCLASRLQQGEGVLTTIVAPSPAMASADQSSSGQTIFPNGTVAPSPAQAPWEKALEEDIEDALIFIAGVATALLMLYSYKSLTKRSSNLLDPRLLSKRMLGHRLRRYAPASTGHVGTSGMEMAATVQRGEGALVMTQDGAHNATAWGLSLDSLGMEPTSAREDILLSPVEAFSGQNTPRLSADPRETVPEASLASAYGLMIADFVAENSDELSASAGALVWRIDQPPESSYPGWVILGLESGECGLVPEAYVNWYGKGGTDAATSASTSKIRWLLLWISRAFCAPQQQQAMPPSLAAVVRITSPPRRLLGHIVTLPTRMRTSPGPAASTGEDVASSSARSETGCISTNLHPREEPSMGAPLHRPDNGAGITPPPMPMSVQMATAVNSETPAPHGAFADETAQCIADEKSRTLLTADQAPQLSMLTAASSSDVHAFDDVDEREAGKSPLQDDLILESPRDVPLLGALFHDPGTTLTPLHAGIQSEEVLASERIESTPSAALAHRAVSSLAPASSSTSSTDASKRISFKAAIMVTKAAVRMSEAPKRMPPPLPSILQAQREGEHSNGVQRRPPPRPP